jgi:hypothetical protein
MPHQLGASMSMTGRESRLPHCRNRAFGFALQILNQMRHDDPASLLWERRQERDHALEELMRLDLVDYEGV